MINTPIEMADIEQTDGRMLKKIKGTKESDFLVKPKLTSHSGKNVWMLFNEYS